MLIIFDSIFLFHFSSQHNPGAGNFDHNNFPQRYPTGPQQAMPFPPVKYNSTAKLRNKLSFIM